VKAPINPSVLAWAMRDLGLTVAALADAMKLEATAVAAWVDGSDQPTVTQLRKLADLCRRTASFFFLPAPPTAETPRVAFRAAPNQTATELSAAARSALRDAHGMQEFLAWLTRELGLGAAHLPEVSRSSPPNEVAATSRVALGVSLDDQLAWNSASHAMRAWRRAIESTGVSVFLASIPNGPRGFSIHHAWNPLVVVNTHAWNAGARVFTLMHEWAHGLRATDSSCMTIGTSQDREEQWCDRFAAALLMPWDGVSAYLRKHHQWREDDRIEDLDVVRLLANRFKVSMTAATVRLIDEGAAERSLLSAIPKSSSTETGFATSDPDKSRLPYLRLQQFGHRTATLLKRAIQREVVTRHEALSRLHCTYDEFEQILGLAESA
jgi:Zn-dependent peptidase ImmA (M78 family)/transcriptional regulator with XRE-family HTH domain